MCPSVITRFNTVVIAPKPYLATSTLICHCNKTPLTITVCRNVFEAQFLKIFYTLHQLITTYRCDNRCLYCILFQIITALNCLKPKRQLTLDISFPSEMGMLSIKTVYSQLLYYIIIPLAIENLTTFL